MTAASAVALPVDVTALGVGVGGINGSDGDGGACCARVGGPACIRGALLEVVAVVSVRLKE